MRWRLRARLRRGRRQALPARRRGRALRYARAFDREDRDDLGRRAPLFGLFPLRLLRAARRRDSRP